MEYDPDTDSDLPAQDKINCRIYSVLQKNWTPSIIISLILITNDTKETLFQLVFLLQIKFLI